MHLRCGNRSKNDQPFRRVIDPELCDERDPLTPGEVRLLDYFADGVEAGQAKADEIIADAPMDLPDKPFRRPKPKASAAEPVQPP